ncbi:MAG: DUF4159 domain-containing protein [Acidobacteria bacterium]|nr:DUF4159 domain-containing protein [Acidobacteriota bacterium]
MLRKRWLLATSAFLAALHLLGAALPQPFRVYPGFEHMGDRFPPDYQEQTEWVFARLMYPANTSGGMGFRGRRGGGEWQYGRSYWTMDYPKSDRTCAQLLRRLTRVHARSVEQPVNLEDGDDVYYWPWMYGVEVGHMDLTQEQAQKLREYLLRGGFLMVDDFHGTYEYDVFQANMARVFPDRPIVEIDNKDQIFHVIYNLDDRYQVPGAQYLQTGRVYEWDGITAHWRGIYDDRGRIMVAICHNMDLGDSWEWADQPEYPEKYSALGIRIAINYIAYAMTH